MSARAPGRHICSDVMSNLPVSVLALPVCEFEFEFEFECWLRSAHSIKDCKSPACAPVQCALLLLFISGESKITRPNNKSSHTLETWTVKHLLSYTNLFNNFFIFWRWVHGVFFFIALLMQWVHEDIFFFWCCTRTQLHLLAWEVENGLKRNERFAEECTEVDSSEDFYCLHVFNNKQKKKDEDGNYHFLRSFRQEG